LPATVTLEHIGDEDDPKNARNQFNPLSIGFMTVKNFETTHSTARHDFRHQTSSASD
jgi:hypothetical protein